MNYDDRTNGQASADEEYDNEPDMDGISECCGAGITESGFCMDCHDNC